MIKVGENFRFRIATWLGLLEPLCPASGAKGIGLSETKASAKSKNGDAARQAPILVTDAEGSFINADFCP